MPSHPARVVRLRSAEPAQKNLRIPHDFNLYPEFRYMGSKRRLLPWLHQVLSTLDFESAWDPFTGSSSVAYLMKTMGRRVVASDFLNFPATIARGLVANPGKHLEGPDMKRLLRRTKSRHDFIQRTFTGVFYTPEDLAFLDRISGNIRLIDDEHLQSLAMTALIRSCLKKQPRGVFTVTGDLSRYDDGRRDLRLTIEEHFFEQIEVVHKACFSNGKNNRAVRGDVFSLKAPKVDLVYLDPPYVPRADDNCYVKRYHFLEGLSCYWQGVEIDYSTKSKKIAKRYTPFSYRKAAVEAFDNLFRRMQKKQIVLSYSSNGYPDLEQLVDLLRVYKRDVRVFEKPHRYHFGTHSGVKRAETMEYLLVGR